MNPNEIAPLTSALNNLINFADKWGPLVSLGTIASAVWLGVFHLGGLREQLQRVIERVDRLNEQLGKFIESTETRRDDHNARTVEHNAGLASIEGRLCSRR